MQKCTVWPYNSFPHILFILLCQHRRHHIPLTCNTMKYDKAHDIGSKYDVIAHKWPQSLPLPSLFLYVCIIHKNTAYIAFYRSIFNSIILNTSLTDFWFLSPLFHPDVFWPLHYRKHLFISLWNEQMIRTLLHAVYRLHQPSVMQTRICSKVCYEMQYIVAPPVGWGASVLLVCEWDDVCSRCRSKRVVTTTVLLFGN